MKWFEHFNKFNYELFGKILMDKVLDVGFFTTSGLLEGYEHLVGYYISGMILKQMNLGL